MAANHRLVQLLMTINVIALHLFFKIKNARVNQIVRRIPKRSPLLAELSSGSTARLSTRIISRSASPELVRSDTSELIEQEIDETIQSKSSSILGDHHHLAPGYELVTVARDQQANGSSNLPTIDKYVRYYYQASLCANWYLLIKHFIMFLLRHETFARFRYLDCLMLGRMIVNGRVIEVAPYCTCYQATIRLVWRYTMMHQRAELRMPCVEFLLNKPAHEQFWAAAARADQTGRCHSTLLDFQSPFETRTDEIGDSAHVYKLRPNRTREAWDILGKCTLLYHSLFAAVFSLLAALFLAMDLPVALTWRGVAYNYRHCLQWLASKRQLGQYSAFSMLANQTIAPAQPDTTSYVKPKLINEFFLPYTQLVEFNRLHLIRFLMEVLESLVVYLELTMSLSSGLYLSVMMSKDVFNYCQSINARLERLIATLRVRESLAREFDDGCAMSYPVRSASVFAAGHAPVYYRVQIRKALVRQATDDEEMELCRKDIAEIQAMVADLFQIIDSYNKFISLHTIFLLMYWLTYSALISSWIFLPGNESPKLEWYVIHCFATLYVFIMLSYMSDVKASCRQLYNRITVAMALDDDYRTRKTIWVSLLTFYKPKPLYCFTLIGSIELTYMSGIQLLLWLFSALVVASSFFRVYNIK